MVHFCDNFSASSRVTFAASIAEQPLGSSAGDNSITSAAISLDDGMAASSSEKVFQTIPPGSGVPVPGKTPGSKRGDFPFAVFSAVDEVGAVVEVCLAVSAVAIAVESVSKGVAGQGMNGGIAVVTVGPAAHYGFVAIVVEVAVFDQEGVRSEGTGVVAIVWGDFTSPQLVVGEDGGARVDDDEIVQRRQRRFREAPRSTDDDDELRW